MSFKIEENSAIPTSWDRLSVITLDAPAPETLYVSNDSSRSLEEGDRLEAENRKILQTKLGQELSNLPVFRLFPGLDVGQLTIIGNNGKVDRQAATALAYLSPGKFSAQLKNALKIDSRSGRGELMGLVVDLGLEEHSGWLLQSLETASLYDQRQVLEAIQNKPWYGDWEPVVWLLKNGHDDFRNKLARQLGDHLTNPKIKGAFIEMGNNPRDPRRLDMASFLLQKLPSDELEPFAVWIDDRDTRFSKQIFTLLSRRVPELGRQMVLSKYSTAKPGLQEVMLSRYKFDSDSIDPEEIIILKSAVGQKPSSKLHANALNALMNAAYRAEVWKCLWELSGGDQLARRELDRVESKLLQNVSRAYPDKAADYYRDTIDRVEKLPETPDRFARSRQGTAISSLLGMDGAKDASVAWLADFMTANPDDGELPLLVIRAVQQFHRIRKGWNWEQPELIAIFETGPLFYLCHAFNRLKIGY